MAALRGMMSAALWWEAGPAARKVFFFELDFVVNRNKRRHTRHDAKHTIARTAPHLAPAPAAPPTPAPPRWERDEEMEQPEERSETNTYGRVKLCVTLPGVSHFPGQPRPCEAGGCDDYPVRPVASTPTPTAHSPLLVPPSNAPDPDKPPDVGPLPRTLPPLCPSHTPRPDMHIQDKPGVLLSKEKKKWEGGDQRGRLPAYATPQRGAAIAEAVPKHNSQTRSGPGGLGGSLPDRCCTGPSTGR